MMPPMRIIIFTTGAIIAFLGMLTFRQTTDPSILQGGLTLGGGFIICGLFSLRSPWHGYGGAAVLGLLGTSRTLSAITDLPSYLQSGTPADTLFRLAATALCLITSITALLTLLRERQRRQIEKLLSSDPG